MVCSTLGERRVFMANRLKVANLKAAVLKADWYAPERNPNLQAFCRHYGCAALPTKPYTPRHKGKVESGVISGTVLW